MPANKALSLNQDFVYGIYEIGNEQIIIELDLAIKLNDKSDLNLNKINEISGKTLLEMKYLSPLTQEECSVYNAEYVTKDTGTGIVHTAPGHGVDDYNTGIKNNLDIFSPVDKYGKFTDDVREELQGLSVLTEGNLKVIELLDNENYLFFSEDYNHKYPYDWRTGKPTIFRSTYQWFASVDKFREQALGEIE